MIWGPGIDLRTPWKIFSLRPWLLVGIGGSKWHIPVQPAGEVETVLQSLSCGGLFFWGVLTEVAITSALSSSSSIHLLHLFNSWKLNLTLGYFLLSTGKIPVVAKPLRTLFVKLSFHTAANSSTNSDLDKYLRFPPIPDLSTKIVLHFFFSGPKQVTSSGWRMSVTWGGNFEIMIFSSIAALIISVETWLKWPSRRRSRGRSAIVVPKFLKH